MSFPRPPPKERGTLRGMPMDRAREITGWDWFTDVWVPILAAAVAAGIVLIGLLWESRNRRQERRARFVDELCQLLIESAALAEEPIDRERRLGGMRSNLHRVRATAAMRKGDQDVYLYASRTANQILDQKTPVPQAAAALAIENLLLWQVGNLKARNLPAVEPTEVAA